MTKLMDGHPRRPPKSSVPAILDEIKPGLPIWLDEGTAVYLGPHAITEVPAADLFAYTAVDIIVSQMEWID